MTEEAPWTIGRLLTWTTDYFAERGVESPRLDAEVLLAHARGCPRIALYTAFEEKPDDETRARFKDLVRRRAGGSPVAHVVGYREFYSLEMSVTPDVLIPRPETELLVVTLLDRLKEREQPEAVIADIGTGSGAVAVAVAKQAPKASLTAIDKSPAALAVAQRNAEKHGVADRIRFVESDLLGAVQDPVRFDFIVSNPPYVTTNELAGLEPEVRDQEPRLALDGGPEGVTVIEPLLAQAAGRLAPGGGLLIEIGPSIAERVERLIEATPGLGRRPTIKDLAGHARVVEAVRSA
ncbi:Release factor glutamine methyltransferase [Pseudobythopirellula maris]|uniref:Release factor glutamine methyltransferase n=1 Tax=Pseudobythopirellula maris TaxID=2527991 RepID=A0A5C5ZGB5_9BACT|nr:peptide chain release factor N(5)-glutamine methyltransferase [Pseudobythopirellula maris]TWT86155.1 Release factor glutamine methyltransferase [Pseudobythopirellula maris]